MQTLRDRESAEEVRGATSEASEGDRTQNESRTANHEHRGGREETGRQESLLPPAQGEAHRTGKRTAKEGET